ncbi:MAG: IS200/IS605 family transposase [Phycisphaerae bacterium]|nr:IS200/IS605 family transposase [Phycisphaerae bacterium]
MMSYTDLNYHIVYATKTRRPFLSDDILPRLIKYTGGILRELGGRMIEAGGAEDHLHVMTILPPTVAVANVIRDVKSGTSGWVHQTFPQHQDFHWQDGYAAFTVSHSAIPKVLKYIRGQQDHHRKMTFEEELRALLKRHGIVFDERFING